MSTGVAQVFFRICRRRLPFIYASCGYPFAARSVYIDVYIRSKLIYDHAADAYTGIFFRYTYGKIRFCKRSGEVMNMDGKKLKELDNAAIGARIRARRESLDMTRADLAGRIPMNEKSVAEIEYGNRGLSLKTLFRLKQILGVSTDYILEGTSEDMTEEEQKSILRDNIMDSLSICSENQLICMEGITRLCTESIVMNK